MHGRIFQKVIPLMRPILISFGRAVLSQLHYRMLMPTLLPFFLSILIWGLALWWGLQPLIDWLQKNYFASNAGIGFVNYIPAWLGLGARKTVIVPWLALWLLLPWIILTVLLFVDVFALPATVRHVCCRHFSALELREGGSLLGSIWTAFSAFLLFCVLWLVTLPLWLISPFALLIPLVLWGWLIYRVFAYEALAAHADKQELRSILRTHRWPLLVIGIITGAMGAAPTVLWLGGALLLVVFPLLATGSILLYVLVFVFTGLWFEYYCLEALAKYRSAGQVSIIITKRDDREEIH